jgi:hypothetical protein
VSTRDVAGDAFLLPHDHRDLACAQGPTGLATSHILVVCRRPSSTTGSTSISGCVCSILRLAGQQPLDLNELVAVVADALADLTTE